ncbi:MAG: hypothetical protein ACH34U_13250, partial [Cyanobium sp.]
LARSLSKRVLATASRIRGSSAGSSGPARRCGVLEEHLLDPRLHNRKAFRCGGEFNDVARSRDPGTLARKF